LKLVEQAHVDEMRRFLFALSQGRDKVRPAVWFDARDIGKAIGLRPQKSAAIPAKCPVESVPIRSWYP
jgi:hypothetical protein